METPGKKFTDLVEIESPQDTDLTLIRNETGVKKATLQKLSDYIKQKFVGWVFSDLTTKDKTIPGAIKELNSALAGWKLIETATTGDNGGITLAMQNKLTAENMYIIFIRHLGADNVYPPYAMLLYMRSENYNYTFLGEAVDFDSTTMVGGKLTIKYKTKQWARMWIYKIS